MPLSTPSPQLNLAITTSMGKYIKATLSFFDQGGLSLQLKNIPYYWCGGNAGAENDWNDPMNWYNRQVPGWFDEVVIPKHKLGNSGIPIIDCFVSDIAKLTIEDGGKLMIAKNGKLTIDGLAKKSIGLENEGDLVNFGELTVQRTCKVCMTNYGTIINRGSVAFDKTGEKGFSEMAYSSFINKGEIIYLC